MRAFVDAEKCLGCGLCCANAPDVFRMAGGTAEAYADVTDSGRTGAEEAADSCPVAAIRLEA